MFDYIYGSRESLVARPTELSIWEVSPKAPFCNPLHGGEGVSIGSKAGPEFMFLKVVSGQSFMNEIIL